LPGLIVGFFCQPVSVIRILQRAFRVPAPSVVVAFFIVLGGSTMRVRRQLMLLGGPAVRVVRRLPVSALGGSPVNVRNACVWHNSS